MQETNGYIECHVVRVVKAPKSEIQDVGKKNNHQNYHQESSDNGPSVRCRVLRGRV